MALDVNKIKDTAAKIAGEAATAANDVAEQAKPLISRASAEVDALAEKGRPIVEKAEREVRDAIGGLTGKGKNGGGGAF